MDKVVCNKCSNNFTTDDIILTDEFKVEGNIKSYCEKCFLEELKKGFGHFDPGVCSSCGAALALDEDDSEIVYVAKEDKIVHYNCPNSFKDEDGEHDFIGEYTIQPEEEDEY